MKQLGVYRFLTVILMLVIFGMANQTSVFAAETEAQSQSEAADAETVASSPTHQVTEQAPESSLTQATKESSLEKDSTENESTQPLTTKEATPTKEVSATTATTDTNVTTSQEDNETIQPMTLTDTQAQTVAQPKQGIAPSSTTRTILHTNDMHGRLVEEKGRVIGMAKTKTIKAQQNPDLMLDAGDAFQGLPLSNQSKGEEMAKAMNAVGYDAMVPGNHEFDFGYNQLKKLEGMLHFPIISSNVYKEGQLAFKPSTIIEKNGVRYGIIGVTTPETKTKTSPTGIQGVTFEDPLKSVLREMDHLNRKVDVFVILSHLGVDSTTQETWRSDYLTQQLSQNERFKVPIMVIDGHSHTVMQHGQVYGQDLLAQTGTALANIGKITFDFNDQTVRNMKASLINVNDVLDVQPDATVKAQIDKANEAFLKETSEVIIPNNTIDFQGERDDVRRHETNLGNAIADAMEAYSQTHFSHPADFAVTNSGGIRASIAKGKVTLNDIITVLPFGNTIAQIQVKGSDVRAAFEHSLGAPTENDQGTTQLSANGGLLQVSKSIRVYFDINAPSGQRIKAIHILNQKTGKFEALDPNRTYRIATNDFTASGGDGFTMLNGPREEGLSLDKVFADYLKEADLAQYDTTQAHRIINGEPEVIEPSTPSKIIPFPNPKSPSLPHEKENQVQTVPGHEGDALKGKLASLSTNKGTPSLVSGMQINHQGDIVSKTTGQVVIPNSKVKHYKGQLAYVNDKGELVSLKTGEVLLNVSVAQHYIQDTLPHTGQQQESPIIIGGLLVIGGYLLFRRYTA
ncbi:5'-nucleotidase C-terminal domain-containing protein [Staphylococcus ratti]|nr:5'-nucleotidase C-terminal domain-containing protein [Staphylococcus ratti]